ncbi:MAG: glutathione S-transferase family protein [Elainellaceae cyanobacterium]
MALGQLVDGTWTTEWTERDRSGRFQRDQTQFRNWITADGSSGFKAEPGRYHLYISLGCPWAHRTVIVRALKGLEDAIGISIVDPVISDQGWKFSDYPGTIPDSVNGADYLWQIYVKANPNYTGRVTVPVLWDTQTQTLVSNESRHIIQMLNSEFNAFASNPVLDLYPENLRTQIDATMDAIYQPINNGVYRSGFASTQIAYEEAVTELFAALDQWDVRLGQQQYLCSDAGCAQASQCLTLADWCLFTTLFRFDLAYHGLFKCNLRRLADYPNLWSYCRELYQIPNVKAVCSIDHVKQLYYRGIRELNPNQIVPKGPDVDFERKGDRPLNRVGAP